MCTAPPTPHRRDDARAPRPELGRDARAWARGRRRGRADRARPANRPAARRQRLGRGDGGALRFAAAARARPTAPLPRSVALAAHEIGTASIKELKTGTVPIFKNRDCPYFRRRRRTAGRKCQRVCKPGSVLRRSRSEADVRPFIWEADRSAPQATNPDGLGRNGPAPSLFGLAPGGVCRAGRRCRGRGGLLPHPFTVAGPKPLRPAFCGTFPGPEIALLPAGDYPAPSFRGARTFLDAPKRAAAARPSGRSYLVFPRSRSKSRLSRIARHSPSIVPSISSGRKRRWKAVTAARASLTS